MKRMMLEAEKAGKPHKVKWERHETRGPWEVLRMTWTIYLFFVASAIIKSIYTRDVPRMVLKYQDLHRKAL